MYYEKENGLIKIHRINIDNKVGKVFNTNKCGKIKIISQNGKTDKNIKLYFAKFLETGTIIKTQYSNIKNGNVLDPMCPLASGVGYLGLDYKNICDNDAELYFSLKRRWLSMISRCYNINNKRYHKYGGNGITVCDRWHNFSNYFYDVKSIEGFNRSNVLSGKLELDKDFLQQNVKNKIYSKDTCIWLSGKDNSKLRELEQKIKCTHPDGTIEIIDSVHECMRRFDMYTWNLYRVLHNKSKHHKGYKFEYYKE